MIWISAIGVPLLVLAVTGLSFLLGLALNQLILLFVHRMRPYGGGVTHLLISPSPDPSSHVFRFPCRGGSKQPLGCGSAAVRREAKR